MDSKHRHELEENDLQAFLNNFGDWWGRHGNKILIVTLIVLASVLGVRLWNWQQTAALQNAWSDLSETQTPEGLVDVANRHRNPAVQAIARLSAGDALLQEVVTPRRTIPGVETPAPADRVSDPQRKLDAAASQYQMVIDNQRYHLIYRLNARLGMATVAEQRRDWDEAKRQFQAVIEQGGDYSQIVAQAKGRLDRLDSLAEPARFAPERPRATRPDDDAPSLLNVPDLLGSPTGEEVFLPQGQPALPVLPAAPEPGQAP